MIGYQFFLGLAVVDFLFFAASLSIRRGSSLYIL